MSAIPVMARGTIPVLLFYALASYAVGSIPWAYTIVRLVTGEDITEHGTGNVGAMNVRRTTGSWGWFALAMASDFLKGFAPVAVAKWVALGSVITPVAVVARTHAPAHAIYIPMAAVAGAVIGHNYSIWMALLKRRFTRTGKGLATGAGTMLAYDWRYFLVVLVVGLVVIAITRYMMAGQVAAAVALPLAAFAMRSADWPLALAMGAIVYAAHHKRFVGLLQGREPKLYVNDRSGPRG